jgi:hypothetical protein
MLSRDQRSEEPLDVLCSLGWPRLPRAERDDPAWLLVGNGEEEEGRDQGVPRVHDCSDHLQMGSTASEAPGRPPKSNCNGPVT